MMGVLAKLFIRLLGRLAGAIATYRDNGHLYN